MSLESCDTCGYAVSTVDGSCRHCHPSGPDFATHSAVKLKLTVLLIALAGLLGLLLYRIFLH